MMMLFGILKARAAELVFLTVASDSDRTTVHVRVSATISHPLFVQNYLS
jgi:hypothetical protein